jgi:hypothetical protein
VGELCKFALCACRSQALPGEVPLCRKRAIVTVLAILICFLKFNG